VASELPLEARLAAVPCRGGEGFLRAIRAEGELVLDLVHNSVEVRGAQFLHRKMDEYESLRKEIDELRREVASHRNGNAAP